MKNLLFLLILFVSCTSQEKKNVKSFGAEPIDTNQLKTVPLLISVDTSKREEISLSRSVAPGKKDRQAPTVQINSPTNGATVDSISQLIKISATDNKGVTGVSISIDGSQVSTAYTYTWNTKVVADGPHTIKATAQDAAGNSATTSITVSKVTPIIIIPTPPPPTPTPTPGTLPASYFLTMPAVQNQGQEGSCTAFGICYARDFLIYKATGATSYSNSTNVLSPEMLFNRINVCNFDGRTCTTCTGSALITGLNYLRDTGVCLWASMPYTDVSCTTKPNSQQLAEAAQFKIKSYSQILASDVTAIKTMLFQNRPLVSMWTVDNGFYSADASFIWKTFTGAVGAHIMCVCGYDDSKHAFKVINQWGTSWGDAGYGWVDYDFLKQVSSQLFVYNF